MGGYTAKFYINSKNGKEPVLEYIECLDAKNKAKVIKYIDFLLQHNGYLDEPYAKHIIGKIRELRVDFSSKKHRIFFFASVNKIIILLHAFTKRTAKTPRKEIEKAMENYLDAINNQKLYESD